MPLPPTLRLIRFFCWPFLIRRQKRSRFLDPTIAVPMDMGHRCKFLIPLSSLLHQLYPISYVSLVNSCALFRPEFHSSARHPLLNSSTKSRGGNKHKRSSISLSPLIVQCIRPRITALSRYPPPPCLALPSPVVPPEARFRTKYISALDLDFRFGLNFSASILALLALAYNDQNCLSKAADCLPLFSVAVDIGCHQSYLLVPPYLKILHPLIEILPVTLESLKLDDDPGPLYL